MSDNSSKLELLSSIGGAFGLALLSSCSSSSSVQDGPDVALVAARAESVELLLASRRPVSLEEQVVSEINLFRAKWGRRPLLRHPGLDELAERHSLEMGSVREMSHAGFDRRARQARDLHGLAWTAENVLHAYGYSESTLASLMVTSWIKSRGHRKNLLRANTHIGVGIFRGDGGTVWATQLSARPY